MKEQNPDIMYELFSKSNERMREIREKQQELLELRISQMQIKAEFAEQIGVSSKDELLKIKEFRKKEYERTGNENEDLVEYVNYMIEKRNKLQNENRQLELDLYNTEREAVLFNAASNSELEQYYEKAYELLVEFKSIQQEFLQSKIRVMRLLCEKKQCMDLLK